jgi:hypothetical protein
MRKAAEMRDTDLDGLFAMARDAVPDAPDALLARVFADAERHRPVPALRVAQRRPFWRALLADLGGGGAVAGLATATLAGVWIGFAQPAPVTTLTDALWSFSADDETLEAVDLIPSLDAFLPEG